MSTPIPPELQQANAYLRSGQKQSARDILMTAVRRKPDSEAAWLLLSQVMENPRQQADCLRQVLRINPGNQEALQRLELLESPVPDFGFETPAAEPAPRVPPQATPAQPASPPEPEPTPPVAAENVRDLFVLADEAAAGEADRVAGGQGGRQASKVVLPRKNLILLIALGIAAVFLVCIALGLVISLALGLSVMTGAPPAGEAPAAGLVTDTTFPTTALAVFELPPTWTPTFSPMPTSTPTITPTPQPSATSTLQLPPEAAQAQMSRIEQEVSDVRGLPILSEVPRYIVSPLLVEAMLQEQIENEGYIPKLTDQARYLSALGLIKPTYDLVRYAMNGLVDNIGGFYRPANDDIYVLGIRFGGVEHYIYSHEFDHAIVDQHYDLVKLKSDEACKNNSDHCYAIKALIEGDATLLMNLWFQQYATPQDYKDILSYRPPAQALPEQFPPEYVSLSLDFPYKYGLTFVESLYKQNNWAAVNQAYGRLPASTEQILHPEKYVSGEEPVPVQDILLESVLGKPWRGIAYDVLGEWTTYLVLAASADLAARQDPKAAQAAAQGWGGDRFQVLYNEETDKMVLAVHWVWDSQADAREFAKVMLKYLDQRFKGAKIARPAGSCWEVNQEATCLYVTDSEALWLLAPDQAILDKVLLIFPVFSAP